MNATETPKGKKFIEALVRVCQQHGYVIAPEFHDRFQVWSYDENCVKQIRGAEWKV